MSSHRLFVPLHTSPQHIFSTISYPPPPPSIHQHTHNQKTPTHQSPIHPSTHATIAHTLNHPSSTIYIYLSPHTHPSLRSSVWSAKSSVEVAAAAFALWRRVDRVAELVECLRASGSPLVPPPLSETNTAEYIERCEALLSAANLLVQAHNEFFREATSGLTPRDQAFHLQQREHFLDHLQESVVQLESTIEHQQALAAIFHGRPLNPNTGLPIVYPSVIPTASRFVHLHCSAHTVLRSSTRSYHWRV